MTLKATVTKDDYAGLDDSAKSFYKESGDNYILDAEGVEDVSGLKSALEKERKARAEFEKHAKKYEGVNLDDYNAALDFKKKADEKKLMDKGEFDKIRAADLEKHKQELEKQSAEVKRWQDAYQKSYVSNAIKTGLVAAGVLPEAVDIAALAFMPNVKFEMKDSDVLIQYIDEHGLDSGKSLEENISAFREKNKFFFSPSGAAGSGASNGQNKTNSKSMARKDFEGLEPDKQMEFIKSGGAVVE